MELVDMRDLGSRAAMRVGSSPFRRTSLSQAAYRLRRLFSKVIAHSFRRSSFPNRTRCAGLRFGFGYSPKSGGIHSVMILQNMENPRGVDPPGFFLFSLFFQCFFAQNEICAKLYPPGRLPPGKFICYSNDC